MALYPSDYALVIGINDYPFHTKLEFAHNDANAFKDWLIDTDAGGGIPESNIAFLLSEVRGDEVYIPSPQDVDVKLRKIISLALKNQQQVSPRRFYLYFSGHGLGVKATDVGLCLPFWSKASNAGAMLKMSAYLNYLIDLGLFSEIFVFLDCCRNALQAPGGHEPSLSINKPNPGAATSQHLVAFATTYTNAAFEAEQKMGNNADENRGFFTSCLLEALNGAAADKQGGVPLNKLLEYLDGRVPQLAASKGKTQKAAYSQTFNLTEMSGIILGAAKPSNQVTVSKSIDLFLFSVRKPGVKHNYELSIFNEKFEIIYKGFDSFSGNLPPGNYIVRSQMGDNNAETHIDHRGPETNIEAPELNTYSSVLLQGAQSSHEYYTDEAVYWSKNQTDAKLHGYGGSHLFFFARFPNKTLVSDYNLFSEMRLLDENLLEVHRFPKETYRENREYGWYAFSYSCKPGQYYLSFEGSLSRIIPVYCFLNWQTQLFITLKDNVPLFETLRILTARIEDGFQPNKWVEICDLAFDYLKNPELELPPALTQSLLDLKFDNPMLGILGAYLVLQRRDEQFLSKMPIVIQNLKSLLNAPDCVDLRAIQAIFNYKENKFLDFSQPPMVAFGIESLLLLENKKHIIIPADSVFGRMTLSRKNDLVFSSWNPTAEAESEHNLLFENTQFTKSRNDLLFGRALVEFIANSHEQVDGLNKELIARQLAVPFSKVEQAINQIVENPVFLNQINNAGKFIITYDALLLVLKQIQKVQKMKIVTICHPDEHSFLNELKENCLDRLQENGFLEHWNSSDILFGNRKEQIEQKVRDADCVIGLISMPYFGADREVKQTHNLVISERKVFIPIIVRDGYYNLYKEIEENTPYPRENGKCKPLEKWNNRSEAWAQISERLLEIKVGLGL